MSRQAVISFSNNKRLSAAREWLDSVSGRTEVLIVASSRGAADELVRMCCHPKGGFFGIHRMNLTQLASVLATEKMAKQCRAPVSRLGVEALATRAVHVCRENRALVYFLPVSTYPGFARALAGTLTELRMNGVGPQDLVSTGRPGADLATLMNAYESELTQRSLADLAVLYRLAVEVVQSVSHRLVGLPTLLLDVAATSRLERKLVEAVAERAPASMDTTLGGQDGGTKESSLDRVRHYVFSLEELPRREMDESVEFFSAPGEGRECIEIARRIRFAAEKGVAFDQIAVLLRQPETYQPLLEDALRKAGIPAYFTRGALRPDPAGRAFLSLLACAGERLSASRFAEYLSLGQVPVLDEDGTPPQREVPWVSPEDENRQLVFKTAAPSAGEETSGSIENDQSPVIAGTLRVPFQWEKLLVEAAVIGGKERWSRRLKGLENEFQLQLNELAKGDDPRCQHIEKQLQRLGNLQRFALPLIDFLDALPDSALWGEWLSRLRKLAGMSLRHPESVLSVLNELSPMEEVGPVTLEEAREVLTHRLSFLRTEPPPQRYGRVFVGTIDEANSRSFEVVFLPGVAEGIFPRKSTEDPLLLDHYRSKLKIRLPIQESRFTQERLLLRSAAGAAASKLVASYPRMDVVQGRSRVPSFYALDIIRAAEGRLPDLRELEKRAAGAAGTRLGWPAPNDFREAIDDSEYDLAIVAELLRKPAQKTEGHARYLLSVNPHLGRSLRARARRWRNFWSEADGIVDPGEAALSVLNRHRLHARPYSATALQHFSACPYRFLLAAICQLEPREEAVAIEQMDALTRGSLFHEVQFELLGELKRAQMLPLTEKALLSAMGRADEVLDRVAARYEEELAPAIPRIWRSEVEDLRTDLRGWLRLVTQSDADWEPLHFEYAFGMPAGTDRDPQSSSTEALILNKVRLRGSVDLIERHRKTGMLRVVDHKTGKAPKEVPRFLGRGEVLQPLLYALAAEQLLKRKVESGQLFFCTQRGDYTRIEVPLSDEAKEKLEFALETIDKHIQNGFLVAAPRPGACEYCNYRLVCGPYEEMRVTRKRPEPLTSLKNLRDIP